MNGDPLAIGQAIPATDQQVPVRVDLVVVASSLAPIAAALLFLEPHMQQAWPARQYLVVHTIVETLVIVVAFATFAVQWYAAGARLNDARGRLVGSAFLAVALLELLHSLAFPGMPGLVVLGSSTERGIVYWLSARFWTVGALLAAVVLRPGNDLRALRRGPLVAFALLGVAVIVVADVLWLSRRPLFFVEGIGLTPLKKGLELVVAAAALAGTVICRRAHRDREDAGAADLALALWLTVLSEVCFTFYARAYDSWNLLGHVYLLLAAAGVFHALFVDAVLRPYERLGATTQELTRSNAALERLRAHVAGELEVTIRDLKVLQEQREDLLRAVSHDLRTPLQIVLLQADLLARSTADDKTRRAGERIGTAGQEMAAMIRDLADSVHLESGTLPVMKQPFALRPLVLELVGASSGVLDTDRVLIEIPPDLPNIDADPNRLARVVQNLIGNALKYSAPAKPVSVAARSSGEQIVVSVADQGSGISPEHLPRIFDRFYRGSRTGAPDGLGLGLYIARLIVEAHGGRIWCESTPGVGSTFSFTVPLASRSSPHDSRAVAARRRATI